MLVDVLLYGNYIKFSKFEFVLLFIFRKLFPHELLKKDKICNESLVRTALS